jgi:acyl dehydratase
VRAGDTLSVRVTVLKTAPSKSKPDRGAVTSFVEVINQVDEIGELAVEADFSPYRSTRLSRYNPVS